MILQKMFTIFMSLLFVHTVLVTHIHQQIETIENDIYYVTYFFYGQKKEEKL